MQRDPYDAFRLSLLPEVGGSRGRALLARFRDFPSVLRARPVELARLQGFSEPLARRITSALADRAMREQIDAAVERDRRTAAEAGIRYLPYDHPEFPAVLSRIVDPPLFVHIDGELRPEDTAGVAVVGTRSPSEYGVRVARTLAAELAAAGVTIVSGLALGIDGEAHRAALQAGGRSVAVLGSGLQRVYPAAHRALAKELSRCGCLVSELPLFAPPDAVNFPRRNRLICALARAVVLVESAERGGGMLTARIALDQNREVFAVPGSIFSERSAGPNLLLQRSQAQVCLSAADIAAELPGLVHDAVHRSTGPPRQCTLEEEAVLRVLDETPRHIDEVAAQCGLPVADLLVLLLELEFADLVRQLPGKHFTRC